MLEKYLTPSQYAEKIGLTKQRVHVLIQEGRLRFEKIGKQYFIPKDAKIQPPHQGSHASKVRS